MKSIVKINIDNTMENINIDETKNIEKELTKNANFKGSKNIKELYSWNKKIKVYGWDKGSNYKNIHKLPSCGVSVNLKLSENIQLYGNIFIVCFKNNNIINYNISEYGELHYMLTEDNITEYNSDDENLDKIDNVQLINISNDILLDEDLNEYN